MPSYVFIRNLASANDVNSILDLVFSVIKKKNKNIRTHMIKDKNSERTSKF